MDELLVPGHVDETEDRSVGRGQVAEAEIDRNTPRLLLLEPVGVDSGEGAYKRRLAVVDMARRADDHAGPAAGAPKFARLATNARSSARQRRSKTSAPSSIRPTTGTGNSRNAVASAANARAFRGLIGR